MEMIEVVFTIMISMFVGMAIMFHWIKSDAEKGKISFGTKVFRCEEIK